MLKDEIQKDIINSLKSGNRTEVQALRFVISQIQYAEIEKRGKLSGEETVQVINKEVKKRKEAIEMFKKGKREDLVKNEEEQLKAICRYLPKQVSDEEVERVIEEVILSSPGEKNMGKIIGLSMAELKGKADGSKVASIVKQKLYAK